MLTQDTSLFGVADEIRPLFNGETRKGCMTYLFIAYWKSYGFGKLKPDTS